jgi:hypothetical protein
MLGRCGWRVIRYRQTQTVLIVSVINRISHWASQTALNYQTTLFLRLANNDFV